MCIKSQCKPTHIPFSVSFPRFLLYTQFLDACVLLFASFCFIVVIYVVSCASGEAERFVKLAFPFFPLFYSLSSFLSFRSSKLFGSVVSFCLLLTTAFCVTVTNIGTKWLALLRRSGVPVSIRRPPILTVSQGFTQSFHVNTGVVPRISLPFEFIVY
jgi:hypothetical protein